MPKQFIRVNANNPVKVRLTSVGILMYSQHMERLNSTLPPTASPFPTAPVIDAEGWFRAQLWEVMHLFGERMFMGSKSPIEMVMEIEVDQPEASS